MSDSPTEIVLGTRDYELVPQPIGRIRRKLGAVIEMFQGQAEGASIADLGPRLYDALQVFIPDLDPYWKLLGYGSQEAMDAERYEEAADKSPTPPQLIDAIDSIFKIHGGERLVRLIKNAVGPEVLRAVIRNEYLNQRATPSPSSPSSLQPSGESAPTTSTPSTPTSPSPLPSASEPRPQESEASPLSASLAS